MEKKKKKEKNPPPSLSDCMFLQQSGKQSRARRKLGFSVGSVSFGR